MPKECHKDAIPAKLPRKLSPRSRRFVECVVAGASYVDANRSAYRPTRRLSPQRIAERATRVAHSQQVAAKLAELQSKSDRILLLTLNERFSILAWIATSPLAKNADKIRAIEVYTRISGDQAPDRHEISGAGGATLAVATAPPLVRRLPLAERVASLRAAREWRMQQAAPDNIGAASARAAPTNAAAVQDVTLDGNLPPRISTSAPAQGDGRPSANSTGTN